MKHHCVFAIVPRGRAFDALKHAKKAGATGGTVFYARGLEEDHSTFFGLARATAQEVLMVVCETHKTDQILHRISEKGKPHIAFAVEVTKSLSSMTGFVGPKVSMNNLEEGLM